MSKSPYIFKPMSDKRYDRLAQAFTELQAAAQKVVDATDQILDTEPWPLKYRAPYKAITELRQLLAKNYGMRLQSSRLHGRAQE